MLAMVGKQWYNFRARADWVSLRNLNNNNNTWGGTFNGYHKDKVSIYNQKENPLKALWFRRFVKLNEANKSMQILEVAENCDVEHTLTALDSFNTFSNGNFIVRAFRKFFNIA